MNDKELQSLQSVGLTDKEALTYLDLHRNGQSQTGKICERTNIPSSHIYTILTNLIKKGLVSYKIVNNIKVFRAADPDTIAHLFEEKESRIKDEKKKLIESISGLKVLPSEFERMTDFKYFYGVRGIKSLYTEIINSWNKNDEYCIASAPLESFRKMEAFFVDIVHKKRIKDKVKLKMIVNSTGKKWGNIRAKMPLSEVKYLDINTKTEYGVLNDYFFLITYGEKPYGLLIKDKNFASTYKVFFDILWKQAV